MLWVTLGVCAYVGRDEEGRWYHALLVIAVVATFAMVSVMGYRAEAGLGSSMRVAAIIPHLIVGGVAFWVVRAFRLKRWNVLR
jgi:hypothetical protein